MTLSPLAPSPINENSRRESVCSERPERTPLSDLTDAVMCKMSEEGPLMAVLLDDIKGTS